MIPRVLASSGALGFVGLFTCMALATMTRGESEWMWWGGASVLLLNAAGLGGMLYLIWGWK